MDEQVMVGRTTAIVVAVLFSLLVPFRAALAAGKGEVSSTQQDFFIYETQDQRYPLPTYDRGEKWKAFFEKSEATKAIVSDSDIESFSPHSFAFTLTLTASARLPPELRGFIVVLGKERILGGKFLMPFSQMAVRHPVIYVVQSNDKQKTGQKILWLRPYHDAVFATTPVPTLDDEVRPAFEKIRNHFVSAGKVVRAKPTWWR